MLDCRRIPAHTLVAMSSFVRWSTALRRVFAETALAVALAVVLAPCLDSIDPVLDGLAAAVERADAGGEPMDPECSGGGERGEVDDVDERHRVWEIDSAVRASEPKRLLSEDSVRVRVEDRRRERPPNCA
jgi:hypothetical protein